MRAYLRFFGVVVDQGFRCEASDCDRVFLRSVTGVEPRYCSHRCEQRTWERRVRRPDRPRRAA